MDQQVLKLSKGRRSTKGNKKASKAKEPKRMRYNVERRGFKKRLRDLKRHLLRHPNDKPSHAALPRIMALVTR